MKIKYNMYIFWIPLPKNATKVLIRTINGIPMSVD